MVANKGIAVPGQALSAVFCVGELESSEDRCRVGLPLAASTPMILSFQPRRSPWVVFRGLLEGDLPEGGLPKCGFLFGDRCLPMGESLASAGGVD